jgi:ABC-2 type transport system permease protein
MNSFWGFVKKEFFHIFRDRKTMLILFGLPVAQILIFGYVVTNEIKDIHVAVLDKSADSYTREIVSKIDASEFFIVDGYLNNEEEIEEIFKQGNVKEVIVFSENFARDLEHEGSASVQLVADASDANTANLVVNYTENMINAWQRQKFVSGAIPAQIEPEVRMVFNNELKGVYMFVPGTMALILMLLSAMMTSISIAREKELGTMEILLVSPLNPGKIVIGKVIPYVLLSFTNAIVIIVLSFFVFGLPVQGSLALLLFECFLFTLLALSLGILISTVSNTQQVAMFISLFALMLPTMLLSGFIFPIENMPEVLQWLSHLMPAKYFITIVKSIMIKGVGWSFIWKETLVLVGMTAFFLLLSVKKFSIRLEK